MLLIQRGIKHNEGWKTLFEDGDVSRISSLLDADSSQILIDVEADRSTLESRKSSYYYKLQLTSEEVVECLLRLPPAAMAEAIAQIADKFDLAKVVPEALKGITVGALNAARPKRSVDKKKQQRAAESKRGRTPDKDQEEVSDPLCEEIDNLKL